MIFFAVLSQHTLTVVITDTSVYLNDLCPIIVDFIISPDCSGSSGYSFPSSQIVFTKYFQSQNPRTLGWKGASGNPPHDSQQSVPGSFLVMCLVGFFNISKDQDCTMSLITKWN